MKVEGDVAYASSIKGVDYSSLPKCKFRFYTLSEMITSVAKFGFHILEFVEEERYDNHKNVPGSFTIIAIK